MLFYDEIIEEIKENIEKISKTKFTEIWNLINNEETITKKDLNDEAFFEDITDIFNDRLDDLSLNEITNVYNIMFDEEILEENIEIQNNELYDPEDYF